MSNPAPSPRPPTGGALRLQQNDAGQDRMAWSPGIAIVWPQRERLATERWNLSGAPFSDRFIARS
jgi:hypothetical protein